MTSTRNVGRVVDAATSGATIRAIGDSVESTRLWVHFIQLIVVVSWIFVLFAMLWRAGQIPRTLGVVGLVTCALQIYGVPLRVLLGYPGVTVLAIPLAPAYAAGALAPGEGV